MEGCWVSGGVEHILDGNQNHTGYFTGKAGKVFAVVIADREKATLEGKIDENIHPGWTINSDFFSPYQAMIDARRYKYHHEMVNHSKEYVSEMGVCTNTIENQWWSCFKQHIPGQYYNHPQLQAQLYKCMWIHNFRKDGVWEQFLTMLATTTWTKEDGLVYTTPAKAGAACHGGLGVGVKLDF